MSSAKPMTRLRIIIDTARTESRAMVGWSPGPSITAQIKITSISTMDSVKIRVPEGSPSWRAKCSACRTTTSAQATTSAIVPKRKRKRTGVETAATSSYLVLRAVPAMNRSVWVVPTASLLGDFTPRTPHWLCGNTTYGLWRPHDRYRITVSSIRSWSQTHQYGGHNCDYRDRDRKVPWNQTFLATHDRLRRTGTYHRTDKCWRTGS